MTLSLSQIDYSTLSLWEERNNTEPEILSISYDSSGITVEVKVIDEFFGRDGFYELKSKDDSSFKLELRFSIFFSTDSLIVERYLDEERPIVESYAGVISDQYAFDYVCSELTRENVIDYINEIWIDYQDDYVVKLSAYLNEQQKDTVNAVSFILSNDSVTNFEQIDMTQT